MAIKKQQISKYLLIAVLVLAAIAISYRIYQIQKEKHDFAKAEQSIDALAQKIEQTIGKPNETKKEKSCGRASRAYGNGPVGCSITTNLSYSSDTIEAANSYLLKTSALVDTPVYGSHGKLGGDKFSSTSSQTFSQSFTSGGTVSCVSQYSFSRNMFNAELSCGGKTYQQLYQIK